MPEKDFLPREEEAHASAPALCAAEKAARFRYLPHDAASACEREQVPSDAWQRARGGGYPDPWRRSSDLHPKAKFRSQFRMRHGEIDGGMADEIS
jgi:hypothetical protein